MRQLNGCSTAAPRSSAAKQWFQQLVQKKYICYAACIVSCGALARWGKKIADFVHRTKVVDRMQNKLRSEKVARGAGLCWLCLDLT